jgi:predicted PurR-regulated permease PerM
VLLLVVAVFMAIGLDPIVSWFERRHVRRSLGALLAVLAVAAALAVFVWLAGAQLGEQGAVLARRVRDVEAQFSAHMPSWMSQLPGASNERVAAWIATVGSYVASGVLSVGVALVLTLYLLIDGRRTFEWLIAFVPSGHRPRVQATAVEAHRVIAAYVIGNVFTSALAALTAYVFLLILHVPAALLLALLTGLFDFVPVLGIFVSAVPMVLLALTVSTTAGVLTACFNMAYNAVENYYISPKIFGRELPLSNLAVIVAFAAGAELGGVLGALVALPLAGIYPAVERLWLARHVGAKTVETHRRLGQTGEH